MLSKRLLYLLFTLSNAFSMSYGVEEVCKTNPSFSNSPGNAGNANFGSNPGGDSKSLTETFVSTFSDTVKSSEVLTNVFEISQTTPTNFRNYMYDYVKASATNLGVESPHCVADLASGAVEDSFESLEPPVMMKVFANTAAKFLQSEGLLNPTNVASLAAKYTDTLKEISSKNVMTGNPEWKLKSLLDGMEQFLISFDLLAAEKGPMLASTFANEVKLAAKELRTTNNF